MFFFFSVMIYPDTDPYPAYIGTEREKEKKTFCRMHDDPLARISSFADAKNEQLCSLL